NTTSVDRRTLAVPPPATKYGVTRAEVVGNCTRTFVVKNTARPSVTFSVAPGKIDVTVLTSTPEVDRAEIGVDRLGNDPLRRGADSTCANPRSSAIRFRSQNSSGW